MWEEKESRERERERERRSIHINTKSAKNPDRRIMQSKRSLTFTSPLSFFLAFSKATTTKSHTLKHTKETLNRKERRYLIFHHSCWACILYFSTKETYTTVLLLHNKWFYVFHIFFGVCIRKRSTPRVWWSSVSVVLTPRSVYVFKR